MQMLPLYVGAFVAVALLSAPALVAVGRRWPGRFPAVCVPLAVGAALAQLFALVNGWSFQTASVVYMPMALLVSLLALLRHHRLRKAG